MAKIKIYFKKAEGPVDLTVEGEVEIPVDNEQEIALMLTEIEMEVNKNMHYRMHINLE